MNFCCNATALCCHADCTGPAAAGVTCCYGAGGSTGGAEACEGGQNGYSTTACCSADGIGCVCSNDDFCCTGVCNTSGHCVSS